MTARDNVGGVPFVVMSDSNHDRVSYAFVYGTRKEREMLTFSVSTTAGQRVPRWTPPLRSPRGVGRWTRCQTESLEHVAVLEQATMAVLEGYLSGPLYYRAAYAAQQLLALTEMMAWREGTHIARAMTHLFHTDVAFDLVHALHLSELIAAFYREVVQATTRRTPTQGCDAAWYDSPDVSPAA